MDIINSVENTIGKIEDMLICVWHNHTVYSTNHNFMIGWQIFSHILEYSIWPPLDMEKNKELQIEI